jgi:NADPH-dependent 2,4-dienoyl-CoA reductase/sulfur reductase-like enzyme
MKMRIVVIGANAAGAKAAAKAKRIDPRAEVTLIDRGNFISYGACGIPYYVSDTVADIKELMSTPVGVVRDPLFFKKVKGVAVRTNTEVSRIDRDAGVVQLLETTTAEKSSLAYDRLILATGSTPFIPKISNVDLANILTVKSIEDAELLKNSAVPGAAACIVGGGLIGLETAEALQQKGRNVTVIEMRDHLLPGVLDPEMAFLVEKQLRQRGVAVMTECTVTGFGGETSVKKVVAGKDALPADLVVLAPGGEATFPGVIGTSILRVFSLNVGKTGLTETEARNNGYDIETALSPAPDKAHFFPGAKPIVLKLIAERKTGRLLGPQAVGEGSLDKRIDAAATAITFQATAEQLSPVDLAYAPPYSAAMDNLIVAADILKNKLAGHARGISLYEVKRKFDEEDDFILLDVRSPAEHGEIGIEGAKLIPLGMLREKLDELPRDKVNSHFLQNQPARL